MLFIRCTFILMLSIAPLLTGCGGGGSSAPEAPAQNELEAYLAENPESANAEIAVLEGE